MSGVDEGRQAEVQVAFRVDDLRVDRRTLSTQWDRMLGIVSTFWIEVDGRVAWSEDGVPVVELAAQLLHWAAQSSSKGKEFFYESLESAEPYLVAFRRRGDSWRIESPRSDAAEALSVPLSALEQASRAFVERIASDVERTLGIDIHDILVG